MKVLSNKSFLKDHTKEVKTETVRDVSLFPPLNENLLLTLLRTVSHRRRHNSSSMRRGRKIVAAGNDVRELRAFVMAGSFVLTCEVNASYRRKVYRTAVVISGAFDSVGAAAPQEDTVTRADNGDNGDDAEMVVNATTADEVREEAQLSYAGFCKCTNGLSGQCGHCAALLLEIGIRQGHITRPGFGNHRYTSILSHSENHKRHVAAAEMDESESSSSSTTSTTSENE